MTDGSRSEAGQTQDPWELIEFLEGQSEVGGYPTAELTDYGNGPFWARSVWNQKVAELTSQIRAMNIDKFAQDQAIKWLDQMTAKKEKAKHLVP